MAKVIIVTDEPEKCRDCSCYNWDEEICRIAGIETKGRYRPVWCPAMKIPKFLIKVLRWLAQ